MAYAKALITKVLNGGASSAGFAASLNDPRYIALVDAFDFAANGATTTSSSSSTAQQTTVNNYYEQTLETNTAKRIKARKWRFISSAWRPNHQSLQHSCRQDAAATSFETAFNLPTTLSLENIDIQANKSRNC